MTLKTCTGCSTPKELNQFAPQKDGKYGVTSKCRTCRNAYNKEYYQRADVKQQRSEYFKNYRNDIKQQVFDHYGRVCACCGEDNEVFLTLDHINNDGAEHRRKLGNGKQTSSDKVWQWVIKNGFPTNFQILCYNCNCGKRDNGGTCPHLAKD